MNTPPGNGHSDSDSDNEEQQNEKTIDEAWNKIHEGILNTNFAASKHFNAQHTSLIQVHELYFGFKLRDFFPAGMKFGRKKDMSKKKEVDKQRETFATTTIACLKKEVTTSTSDPNQILKAHEIITKILLNNEILYLPKALLQQILKFPPKRNSVTETSTLSGIAALPTDTYRYKCDSLHGIDIIRSLSKSPEDNEIIEKFIIPGIKKMIISNCHKKLRSSQTWGAKVMRYVNYSCVLILMIYPNNLKRESEIESWFQEHTDDGGLLKKLPPWEYVCRFFKYYDLVKVEQLYRAHRNESSSDPEQIVSEEKEKSSKPTNGRNSPPNEVYLESKKKFQERYMNLNMKVHDTIEEEIHKYAAKYKHKEVDKNFYLPDLKKHRAFVSDLFNYMWKYHSRFKVGV